MTTDQRISEVRLSACIAHALGMGVLAWTATRLPIDSKLMWAFLMLCLADLAWLAQLLLRRKYPR